MTKKQPTIIREIYRNLGADHLPGIHAYVHDICDSDRTAGTKYKRIVF
jgi:hypothetical protein